ncbi:DUF421 domain-containing protein [Ramlibacter sp. AW1]|uniref:DUF421 domain-containing protein n=1 Tax=Ramlibacter aurantiacus TaxID=2801330 RepID=A0A936ZLX1_9BURK|nr:YetF domain-containing protein [Ramlibacter aurantiacus]MBL0419703.1 DUF421 domain-containing protein [Ramlibacter aurantiacus]
MWFDSWSGIGRVFLVGFASYVVLVLVLRVSGKRTLSKLNAFDLVVTVAMGSALATTLLSKDVAFLEGLAAFLVLVLGQYAVARLSVNSGRFAHLVRSEPRLLVHRGRFLDGALSDERVLRDEVFSSIRAAGIGRLEDVQAVVLETDGSMTVLRSLPDQGPGTLHGVRHPDTPEA